jgi:sporulation protein YlmC with PRC-barrel domain
MEFNHHAKILTSDNKEAGHLERVVIDPRSKQVTHIVFRKGLLNAKDKVLPMAMVGMAAPDEIGIRVTADRVDELDDYEETKYVTTNEDNPTYDNSDAPAARDAALIPPAPAVYAYPVYVSPGYGDGRVMATPVPPNMVREKQVNIPENTVAIKDGAQVTTSDGKHVGKVQEVLTNQDGGKITHFRITRGSINKQAYLIPVEWVDRMDPEELTLTVSEKTIEGLPSMEHA